MSPRADRGVSQCAPLARGGCAPLLVAVEASVTGAVATNAVPALVICLLTYVKGGAGMGYLFLCRRRGGYVAFRAFERSFD